MIRIALILIFSSFIHLAKAQEILNEVLESISANNLQIKASSENRDAEIALARTGLNPSDPQVE